MTGALIKLAEHCQELTDLAGVEVQVIEEPPSRIFVVLKHLTLPPRAYQMATSDVLFITDYQYPMSALDMFWTEVEVIRCDGGVPASAEQIEQYAGRSWRRFSWHRNGIWDPVRNGVLDHYELMQDRLARDARTAA
jgi:hypothetical protein